MTRQDYIDYTKTATGEFPGILLMAFVTECLGRKKSLIAGMSIFSASVIFLMFRVGGRMVLIVVTFIARGFMSGTFVVLTLYTPELYPTKIRAAAMGKT